MDYKKLGTSDLLVSPVCVGCMSFGERFADFHEWTLNQEETMAVVKHALDLGINFFDTANCYAHGTSEEFLGRAIKASGVARDKVVIATKIYFNEGCLSKAAIEREIDGSLKRLGMDYVDLYIIHRFDYNTPIAETMEALSSLVDKGKVRALGASAMYGYQLMKMQQAAKDNGWHQFVSMQNHYNLLYREDERELIPVCREWGMALAPYSPLAAGHLCRKQWDSDSKRSRTDKMAREKYDSAEAADLPIVGRVAELAEKYGVKMSQLALAWLWAKGVTAPLIGATKASHYDDAVKALDIRLTAEDIKYLEELYTPHKIVGAL